MAVDWDALVLGPLTEIFGVAVTYTPAAGSPIFAGGALTVTGVFDVAYLPVPTLQGPDIIAAQPVLGVRASQFPAAYDPARAQGDTFTLPDGTTYVVKAGKADSHGAIRLEANRAT